MFVKVSTDYIQDVLDYVQEEGLADIDVYGRYKRSIAASDNGFVYMAIEDKEALDQWGVENND